MKSRSMLGSFDSAETSLREVPASAQDDKLDGVARCHSFVLLTDTVILTDTTT